MLWCGASACIEQLDIVISLIFGSDYVKESEIHVFILVTSVLRLLQGVTALMSTNIVI